MYISEMEADASKRVKSTKRKSCNNPKICSGHTNTNLHTHHGTPDRLVSDAEVKTFDDVLQDTAKKNLGLDVRMVLIHWFMNQRLRY